ncbi:hypothetical protein ACINKY_21505 [Paenibacillus illinoisensis]|uniref:Uncharacterized protein n=1 Tax=Paenibacillus illinoisensis TaxID=59845 RepID=A0ABW8HYM4_9BACL
MNKIDEIKQALAAATSGERKNMALELIKERDYWRTEFHNAFSKRERALEENIRLRKELEEAQEQNKVLRTEKALLEGELSEANAYKHFEAERTKEAVQLHKELEEERKQAAAVRKAMQDVLYYLQRDSYIPAQDILEQYLALGQEGEGNQ